MATVLIDERLAEAGLDPLERLAWIEVDLEALAHNVSVLAEEVRSASIGVVLKADGYGHGLEAVGRAAVAGGARYLIVATMSEAVRLRHDGYRGHLLLLYPIPTAQAATASRLGLELTIGDRSDVERIATATRDSLRVHLEVDTGLARGGVSESEALRVASLIGSCANLVLVGVWSHLCEPEDNAETAAQVARFSAVTEELARHGRDDLVRHLNASGGLLAPEVPFFDLVRVGLAAYGLAPLRPGHLPSGVRPPMTLKAGAVHVARLNPGDTVGYGGTWSASRKSTIATLPFGYADGWSRSSVPGGLVSVAGTTAKLVGRVSSDAVTVDVTDLTVIGGNEEYTVLGSDAEVSANTVAFTRATISWEVIQQLSGRLSRVYMWGDSVIGLRKESRTEVDWVPDTAFELGKVY